ncbi:MAG: tetraacyldisaccharide 4'-kinase [Legionellales bacterium]|nr:tetraacyldisaccharide 4'-kinase [Legionellales bacterium]
MRLPSWWLKRNAISWFLWPASLLFGLVVYIRYAFYRVGVFSAYKSRLPIIIVGNLNVGGTGKTPLVIALVTELQKRGFRPAVITRGYKSKGKNYPLCVTSDTQADLCGDEPLLIARQTKCPVVVDPNRPRAVKFLEASNQCDIIISDDGLQHYALQRDLEIVVVDSKRQFGNGFLLPAGMLREPVSRLKKVDMVVCNGDSRWCTRLYSKRLDFWLGGSERLEGVYTKYMTEEEQASNNVKNSSVKSIPQKNIFSMLFKIKQLTLLSDSSQSIQIAQFKHKKVHAIAGIGNPEQFFVFLRSHELDIVPHSFPDHHPFTIDDFSFLNEQNLPVLMTEKDAVKCLGLLHDGWYVEIEAILPEVFYEEVLIKVESRCRN